MRRPNAIHGTQWFGSSSEDVSMSERAIIVGRIPIPSDNPAFLSVLAVHVAAGLVCVVEGFVAMLSGKRAGRHPTAGGIYFWSLSVVFVTASALAVMRGMEDYHLFILGVLAFATATFGRTARRQRWREWVKLHISGMGTSYVLLLIAFYVDNGPILPLPRIDSIEGSVRQRM
jgi:hypothetical protein